MERKYAFSWDLLGDIEKGRPNLGNTTRIEVYRLMQFTFRDIIEKHVGKEETDKIFYEAGQLAGSAFFQHMITKTEDLNNFVNFIFLRAKYNSIFIKVPEVMSYNITCHLLASIF